MDKCRSCRHYIIKERSGDMCIWGCELSTCVINDFGKTLNGEPVIVYASELKYCDAADMKTHVNLQIIEKLKRIRSKIDALDKYGPTFHRYNQAIGDCIDIIDEEIDELGGDKKWENTNR